VRKGHATHRPQAPRMRVGPCFPPPRALLRSPVTWEGRGGGEGCGSISRRGSRARSRLPVSPAQGFGRRGRNLVCEVQFGRSVGAPGTPRFLPPLPAKPPCPLLGEEAPSNPVSPPHNYTRLQNSLADLLQFLIPHVLGGTFLYFPS